ncbi:IniB N-terminal domain-containing protein [Microbacterium sp. NPDC058389]|uniref:IniB N-terminal domain-containing protein n=1 Tax=Microbacterium sp. NPDC058389 TaxID=3346475 RepID=UPI00365999A9
MITPIETVADALIAFILSLLHDPSAADDFAADPATAMATRGVQGACGADVRSVAPIIVDHPSVMPRPAAAKPATTPDPASGTPDPRSTTTADPEAVREISRIINQFTTIDARSTIVDQSTNQNIWTQGGDLTQIFDQDAVIASGDHSIAAGDDVTIDESDTAIGVGDVAIGNTSGSHNTTTTGGTDDADAMPTEAVPDPVVTTPDPATVDDAVAVATGAAGTAAAAAVDAVDSTDGATAPSPEPEPEPEPEPDPAPEPPAEPAPLLTDLTDDGPYDSAPLTAAEPESYPDEPLEDQ